jgi:hypothetical protein
MKNLFSGLRTRVFLIRISLGVVFAVLVTHFFFAGASMLTKLALAGVLVFFAYVLEYIHSSKGP